MQKILLSTLLAVTLIVSVKAQKTLVNKDSTIGTEVDPVTRKEVLRLDEAENQANWSNDSEGVLDRTLADDLLWIRDTGVKLTTKGEYMADFRSMVQLTGGSRNKAEGTPNKHDEFRMKRYGDVIVESGRSTVVNRDKSLGPSRRYTTTWVWRGGQWWIVAHTSTPVISGKPSENLPK